MDERRHAENEQNSPGQSRRPPTSFSAAAKPILVNPLKASDEAAYVSPDPALHSKPRVSFPQIITTPPHSIDQPRPSTSDPHISLLAPEKFRSPKLDKKNPDDDDDDDIEVDDDENDPGPARRKHAAIISAVLFVTATIACCAMFLPMWFTYTGSYFENGLYTKFSEKAGLYLGCTEYSYYKSMSDMSLGVNIVSKNYTCRDLLFINCAVLVSEGKDVIDILALNNSRGNITTSNRVLTADVEVGTILLPISEKVLEQSAKIPCRQNKASFVLSLFGVLFAYIGVGTQISNARSDFRIQLMHLITVLSIVTL
ncbi:hypothetical protein HK096_011460, partial [Nowakowskiella sp. JEL0078]